MMLVSRVFGSNMGIIDNTAYLLHDDGKVQSRVVCVSMMNGDSHHYDLEKTAVSLFVSDILRSGLVLFSDQTLACISMMNGKTRFQANFSHYGMSTGHQLIKVVQEGDFIAVASLEKSTTPRSNRIDLLGNKGEHLGSYSFTIGETQLENPNRGNDYDSDEEEPEISPEANYISHMIFKRLFQTNFLIVSTRFHAIYILRVNNSSLEFVKSLNITNCKFVLITRCDQWYCQDQYKPIYRCFWT